MTDHDIAAKVREELAYEPSLRETEICVSTEAGELILTGTVGSYPERLTAERAALRVKGVRSVANRLEVVLDNESKRSDNQIAAMVSQVLSWTVNVPAVQATVQDGVVGLSGEADWQYQREAAETAVKCLVGVRAVQNLIRVRPTRVAARLQDAVEAALRRSSLCDTRQIVVEAEGAGIRLSGWVSSWSDRDEAERIAWAAPGVGHVDCCLKVQPKHVEATPSPRTRIAPAGR